MKFWRYFFVKVVPELVWVSCFIFTVSGVIAGVILGLSLSPWWFFIYIPLAIAATIGFSWSVYLNNKRE